MDCRTEARLSSHGKSFACAKATDARKQIMIRLIIFSKPNAPPHDFERSENIMQADVGPASVLSVSASNATRSRTAPIQRGEPDKGASTSLAPGGLETRPDPEAATVGCGCRWALPQTQPERSTRSTMSVPPMRVFVCRFFSYLSGPTSKSWFFAATRKYHGFSC